MATKKERVPGAGLEPARTFVLSGLSALRLPFRHPGITTLRHKRYRDTDGVATHLPNYERDTETPLRSNTVLRSPWVTNDCTDIAFNALNELLNRT
jgi:hypothetical protein